MEKVRPWQIVVFSASLLAICYAVWSSLHSMPAPELAHKVMLVDVTNGQLFEFATDKKAVALPEKNPETGQETLLPVLKEADGKWRVSPRHLGIMTEIKPQPSALVDTKTGEVRVAGEQPTFVGNR